jgi:hypothetical protein
VKDCRFEDLWSQENKIIVWKAWNPYANGLKGQMWNKEKIKD